MHRLVMNHPVITAVAGVVLVTSVVTFATHGTLFASNHETQNGSPVSAFNVTNDPKPLAKVPASGNSGSPDSSSNQSNQSTATTNSTTTPSPALALTKTPSNATNCSEDIPTAVNQFNHDVQKEKDALNSILSFRVGTNIGSQYVTDYNTKVTSIYNEYLSEAKADHCTWPIKDIPLLDPNDPYDS